MANKEVSKWNNDIAEVENTDEMSISKEVRASTEAKDIREETKEELSESDLQKITWKNLDDIEIESKEALMYAKEILKIVPFDIKKLKIAIINYQKDHDLVPDWEVGKDTYLEMKAESMVKKLVDIETKGMVDENDDKEKIIWILANDNLKWKSVAELIKMIKKFRDNDLTKTSAQKEAYKIFYGAVDYHLGDSSEYVDVEKETEMEEVEEVSELVSSDLESIGISEDKALEMALITLGIEASDSDKFKEKVKGYQEKQGIDINWEVGKDTFIEMKAWQVLKQAKKWIDKYGISENTQKEILFVLENPILWNNYRDLKAFTRAFRNEHSGVDKYKDFFTKFDILDKKNKKWLANNEKYKAVMDTPDGRILTNKLEEAKTNWDKLNVLINSNTFKAAVPFVLIGFVFWMFWNETKFTNTWWKRILALVMGWTIYWGIKRDMWVKSAGWLVDKVGDIDLGDDNKNWETKTWIKDIQTPDSIKDLWDKASAAFHSWIGKIVSLNDSYDTADKKGLKIENSNLKTLARVFAWSEKFGSTKIKVLENTTDIKTLLSDTEKSKLKWISEDDIKNFKKQILEQKEDWDIEVKDLFIDTSFLWQAKKTVEEVIASVKETFETDFIEEKGANERLKEKLSLLQVLDPTASIEVVKNLERYEYSNKETSLGEAYNFLDKFLEENKLEPKFQNLIEDIRKIYHNSYKLKEFNSKIDIISLNKNSWKETLKELFHNTIKLGEDIKDSWINNDVLTKKFFEKQRDILKKLEVFSDAENDYKSILLTVEGNLEKINKQENLEKEKIRIILSIEELKEGSSKEDYEKVDQAIIKFESDYSLNLSQSIKDGLGLMKDKIDSRIEVEEDAEKQRLVDKKKAKDLEAVEKAKKEASQKLEKEKIEKYKEGKLSEKPKIQEFISIRLDKLEPMALQFMKLSLEKDITIEKFETELNEVLKKEIAKSLSSSDKNIFKEILTYIETESKK